MLLEQLAKTSQQVAATAARREKIALLSTCLAALEPNEVALGVAYLSGELPQGRIGVAYAALRALALAAAPDASLTLEDVHTSFERIARAQGPGSSALRTRELSSLLGRSTAPEQDFLARLLLGELRQGALEAVMLDAIAQAYATPLAAVRRAAMLSGKLGLVARVARERGEAGLHEFKLELFRPLAPMLAQTASDSKQVLERLGRAALEWKLDGARIQVHRSGDEVQVFTRKLNSVSLAVPELVEAVRALPASSLVLDGEAIVLGEDGRPAPFQVTMRRFGRRLDIERMRAELPLSCFFFDLLHIDGDDVLDRPAAERAQLLRALLPDSMRIERTVVDEVAEADAFLQRALAAGHEGIVAKALDAPYEAGRRGAAWLKLKLAHTLDLVVLAVEWGSGRRRGLLSNLHLGARDESGAFVMLGKTFKGMTDAMLRWQTEHLLALEVKRDAHTVYVKPELVVEVAFDGVQISSHYPGGVALRFTRVKGYRPDKNPNEADTIDTVRALAGL